MFPLRRAEERKDGFRAAHERNGGPGSPDIVEKRRRHPSRLREVSDLCLAAAGTGLPNGVAVRCCLGWLQTTPPPRRCRICRVRRHALSHSLSVDSSRCCCRYEVLFTPQTDRRVEAVTGCCCAGARRSPSSPGRRSCPPSAGAAAPQTPTTAPQAPAPRNSRGWSWYGASGRSAGESSWMRCAAAVGRQRRDLRVNTLAPRQLAIELTKPADATTATSQQNANGAPCSAATQRMSIATM